MGELSVQRTKNNWNNREDITTLNFERNYAKLSTESVNLNNEDPEENIPTLKIIPLGGLNEIG